jgi:hypothetical protein
MLIERTLCISISIGLNQIGSIYFPVDKRTIPELIDILQEKSKDTSIRFNINFCNTLKCFHNNKELAAYAKSRVEQNYTENFVIQSDQKLKAIAESFLKDNELSMK